MASAKFFAEFYGRAPCLVRADRNLYRSLFGWDDVASLLENTAAWNHETLKLVIDETIIDPAEYTRPGISRDGAGERRIVPAEVKNWASKGASIVLNMAETMHPGLRSIAEAISFATNCEVRANIYCSYAGRQAFMSHFDTTDVFVLQMAGAKKWRIYEGRYQDPVAMDGFEFQSIDKSEHDRAKGRVAQSPVLKEGHFLYLPKGQYHEACAVDGPSLHVTFATTESRGIEFLKKFVDSLAEVPEFRAPMPDFDNIAAHDAHINMLAERLRELITQPGIGEQMRADQRRRAFGLLSRFTLPEPEDVRIFRVRHLKAEIALGPDGYQVRVGGAAVPIPQAQYGAVGWMTDRQAFVVGELLEAFPDLGAGVAEELLSKLVSIGLLDVLKR